MAPTGNGSPSLTIRLRTFEKTPSAPISAAAAIRLPVSMFGRPANACGAGSKFLSLKNGSAGGERVSGVGERYFRCAA
jgi:hypothetical protein